ncbi:MAG TPA: DUF4080 domain-containing protein [Syntrophomonadaceae bacterium]|nr:DUF4080 domain-containing protein [Syntrophomonadaceae bacterium]HPR94472.1 DUF4080 domain-containing protein [Syntrophomonadaceae bacterium]
MKILLTTLNAKFIHSSLSLAYLKAYCQNDFKDIYIREYTINEPVAKILSDIYSVQPDVLCFSCYIWNIESIKILCADIKQVLPAVKIIAGGPEVSYDAEHFLNENPTVNYVIRGEGEVTLHELLHCLHQQVSPEQTAGLTYRHKSMIIANRDRPLIDNLDKIPFPYENNLEPYNNRIIYYETSRGCPFNCSYCLSSTTKGVRFFTLERVKRDLKYLLDLRVPEIKFVDRTFNCNEKRAQKIMEYIIANNHSTKFHFEIEVTLLSQEMLQFLHKVPVGMFDFEIGIQSTCRQTIAAVNRNHDWHKQRDNIAYLIENCSIHIHLDLIAGLPYEDYERFKISFNNVCDLKPDVIQLGFLKLLKGSAIRDQSREYGYIFEQKPPYQVLGNNYITYEELLKLSQIEDLISRYYNTGIADNLLAYIIKQYYQGDAFAFWQVLADFLNNNNFFRYGHRREEEYSLLHSFIVSFHNDDTGLVELLKLDYFLCNPKNNLPGGFTSNNPDNVNEILYSYLKDEHFIAANIPDLINKTPRERRRMAHLEYLFIAEGYIPGTEAVPLLFIYNNAGKRAKILRISPSFPG